MQKQNAAVLTGIDHCLNREFPKMRVEIVYQPQVSCCTGEIIGWEALARFSGVESLGGNTQAVIRRLENQGIIHLLDFYVLKHVFENIENQLSAGYAVQRVSINISQYTLMNEAFLPCFLALRKQVPIPVQCFILEITETAEDVDQLKLMERLESVREMGVLCSLDDFGGRGVALSSLTSSLYTEVKIDKSLTDTLVTNPVTQKLFSMIAQFCKETKLYTVVEGVESKQQYDVVCDMGFDAIQGYYISKPLPSHARELFSLPKIRA